MKAVSDFQSVGSVNKYIDSSLLKCERDVRRVYRSRNKIVHQGNIDDHNEYIAEMAHYYLDLIFFSIIERKIGFDDIRSIDNLMNELRISIDCRSDYMRKAGSDKFTDDTYKGIVAGSFN